MHDGTDGDIPRTACTQPQSCRENSLVDPEGVSMDKPPAAVWLVYELLMVVLLLR